MAPKSERDTPCWFRRNSRRIKCSKLAREAAGLVRAARRHRRYSERMDARIVMVFWVWLVGWFSHCGWMG